MINISRILVLATTMAFATPGPALAHAHLVRAIPAAGAMAMPPPSELRLKFSEAIELKFTKVKLLSVEKSIVDTGPATLDPKDRTLLVVPIVAPLVDGKYTVEWQALSTDGHKTKGSFGFESMK